MRKKKEKEIQNSFNIECIKCKDRDIELYSANYDGLVGIKCNACGNKFTSY